MIIALTHMRNYQDHELARKVPDIDLILGGHDHVKMIEFPVIKSGDNFKSFSVIKVFKKGENGDDCQYKGNNFDFSIELHYV